MEVHSWNQMADAILLRKVAFVVAFFVIFLSTYAVLAWFDFLPELVTKNETLKNIETKDVILDSASTTNPVVAPVALVQEEVVTAVLPLSMRIEALDKTITVLNPTSREVADLDEALLSGVVRHPDSATLEQTGTVFILGHSSYLPVVRNKNFQALNGIQNLKWGDLITITAAEGEYVYRVDKVYRAKAADVTVPIAGSSKRLFLATCNSFGSTDDRYIVEADFIEVSLF
jgi:LPXTG-site transpeptidase (sortase) family protein